MARLATHRSVQSPAFPQKEPYISAKEPYISANEPWICRSLSPFRRRAQTLASPHTARNRALYFRKKSPIFPQKSSTFPQKSPGFVNLSFNFGGAREGSPCHTLLGTEPCISQKSPTFSQKSPTFPHKRPGFVNLSLNFGGAREGFKTRSLSFILDATSLEAFAPRVESRLFKTRSS